MATEAEIKTIVTANIADFEAKMRKAIVAMSATEKKMTVANKGISSSFSTMKSAVQGFVGVFAIREVIGFGNSLLKLGGDLSDLAAQTGVSVTTLSALSGELQASGSNVNEFAASVTKMNEKLSEAASGGNAQLVTQLNRIGLSIEELRALSPEQQFFKIAEALGKVKDQGDLTAIGVDIFGKSFKSLIPIIVETNGKLEEYAKKAKEAGTAISKEDADTLDRFGDSMTKMGVSAKNAAAGGLASFIRAIEQMQKSQSSLSLLGFGGAPKRLTESALDRAYAKVQKERASSLTSQQIVDFSFSGPKQSQAFSVGTMRKIEVQAEAAKTKVESLNKETKKNSERAVSSKSETSQAKILESVTKAAEEQDKFNEKMLEAQRFSNELGGAFRDAFTEGMLGARKFGDVLSALGQRITQILFNKIAGDPISNAFSKIAGNIFGGEAGGGFFDKIIGSYATGTRYVPRDGMAMLHKGEQVVTRSQVDSAQRNSTGGATGNVYNIDARGADVGAVSRLERSLIALAGPGVIENRVLNAQTRGAI